MIFTAGQILASLCLFFCLSVQVSSAAPSVALVLSSDAAPYRQAAEALKKSLSQRGVQVSELQLAMFSDSESLSVAVGDDDRVWVTVGSRATSRLNSVLPVSASLVYCMVADPEKMGLESGRKKMAGIALTKSVEDQFAIIQTAIPTLRAIGMLYNSSSAKSLHTLADAKENLPSGWRLEAIDVAKRDSIAGAIQELFKEDVGLIWTMADSAVYNRATVKSLLLASLRNQVPVFGFSGSFVKAGALLGLEADPVLQGEYAASLVLDRLGGNSRDRQPLSVGVTLVVNMVVAERLGISLPARLLKQASGVGVP